MAWPAKEADLGPPVTAHLQNLGFDVYFEVDGPGGIADIVAVRGRIVWVVELKKSLSLAVIAQASSWHRYAHFASVAVPRSSRWTKARSMALEVLDWQGLGLIEVEQKLTDVGTEALSYQPMVHCHDLHGAHYRQGRLNRQAWSTTDLIASLCPEHKTAAKPGTKDGGRWTPFRATSERIIKAVAAEPGIAMKALVEAVDHHYASDGGARVHIANWIRSGVITGVRLEKVGRKLCVYPTETT